MKSLIVIAMIVAAGSAAAGTAEDEAYDTYMKSMCGEVGRFGTAGFFAKKEGRNVQTVMAQLSGPQDKLRYLQMEAINYGYNDALTRNTAFSYGYDRCKANFDQLK